MNYEVRTCSSRVLSRHRSMFVAACACALWNILHREPSIHWLEKDDCHAR